MKNQIVITLPNLTTTVKNHMEKKVSEWTKTVNAGTKDFKTIYKEIYFKASDFCKELNAKLGTEFFKVSSNNTIATITLCGENGLQIVWNFNVKTMYFSNNFDQLPSYHKFMDNDVKVTYQQCHRYSPKNSIYSEEKFFELVSLEIARNIYKDLK